jgi:predicted RNase H-like HicB family nuclease
VRPHEIKGAFTRLFYLVFHKMSVLTLSRHRVILNTMKVEYTAIVKKDGDWWIGWVEEVPGVNAQERTKQELLKSLADALKDIFELNREDARKAAVGDYEELPLPA